MSYGDLALITAAAYLAVTALVRLMLRRRDQTLDQFQEQVDQERARRAESQTQAKKARKSA